MKNIITSLCLLFFSITITHAQAIRTFGDSFTMGIGAASQESYPEKLHQFLNYPTQNFGIGGALSVDILNVVQSYTPSINYPSIIWSGYNDIDWGRFTGDIQQAVNNVQASVNVLGHQRFLVLSVINNCSRPKGTEAYDYTMAVNQQLKQLYGPRYLDVRDSMVHWKSGDAYWDSVSIADDVPNHYLMTDCVHANGVGYTYVAQKISEVSSVLFSSPLPVTFTGIAGTEKNNGIQITWNVGTESNINHYEIERSTDGRIFTKTSAALPKNNNNNAATYEWFDATPSAGTNFYRIKSVDNSGVVKYSTIVKVNLNKSGVALSLYPNPAKDFVMTTIVSKSEENAVVNIYNATGNIVKTLNQHLVSGTNNFSIDVRSLPPGMYMLQYNSAVSRFMK